MRWKNYANKPLLLFIVFSENGPAICWSVFSVDIKKDFLYNKDSFGKTVMANMIGAFFEKGEDTKNIFGRLKISKSPEYEKHRNRPIDFLFSRS